MGAAEGALREQTPLLPEPVPRAGRFSCASASGVRSPSSRKELENSSGTLLTGTSLKATAQKVPLTLPKSELPSKCPTADSDLSTTDTTSRSQDCESDTGVEEHSSSSCAIPRAVRNEARVIILDWDDTLLPTSFLRDAVKIYSNWAAGPPAQSKRTPTFRKGGKSNGRSSSHTPGFPCMAALEAHADLVREVLFAARSIAPVAIVTLAERPWVHDSAEHYLPKLNLARLLRDLRIPVYYAVEYRRPNRNPIIDTPPSVSKRLAMEDYISTLDTPHGCRHNILSVGDSMAEREAAKHARAALSKRAQGMKCPLPICKTIKFQADPSLKILSWELRGLLARLKRVMDLDSDLDLVFDQQDSIEDIEEKWTEAVA